MLAMASTLGWCHRENNCDDLGTFVGGSADPQENVSRMD